MPSRPACPAAPLPALLAQVPLPALLALALLVAGCRPTPPPPERLPLVRATPLDSRRFSTDVEGIATLEALQEVQLAAQSSGRIERLLVRQGDRVPRGALLLVLDQVQARAEVARLQAALQTEWLNYRRFESLVRQGAATPFQRDEYRQRYISAREQWVARRADLAFRQLRAPIAGTIADLQVKPGDLIEAGRPISRILRNDRLLARMEVPAVYSSQLKPGLPLLLLDPGSGQPLGRAPLRTIDPGIDPTSQTLLVKGELANPDGRLRSGLRSRAKLILEDRRLPAVPFAAVSRQWGQSFVTVLGDLEALRRRPGRADLKAAARLPRSTRFALQTPVRLGPLQGGWYPVLSGVPAGREVITANLLNLRHGQPVRLQPAP